MLTEGQLLTSRYRIDRMLKSGGMGAIYIAFDFTLRKMVAIKENRVEDPSMRAAFRREAQLLANLQHPSLPDCIDLLEVDGILYLVMKLVEGEDLAVLMTKRRTWLPNETVEDLAWQMLDVLGYVHCESVLHRDIKPANIKVKDGHAYLLDFGIAYGQLGEMDTIAVGEFNWEPHSKPYSPLEQLECRRTSPASDLYSLAATLYYLLTNVRPVDAEERDKRVRRDGRDPLEDIRFYNSAANERVSYAIMQALSISADKRPQSASEMREMMFAEEVAVANGGRGYKFLTARLLSEVIFLCILAYLAFPILAQWVKIKSDVPPPPPVITSTPVLSHEEESARLTEEAEQERYNGDDDNALSMAQRAQALDEKNVYALYINGDILLDAITNSSEFGENISEVIDYADRILSLAPSPRNRQEGVARAWANYVKAIYDRQDPDPTRLDQSIADSDEVLTKYDQDSVAALTLRASATWMKFRSQIDEQTAGRVLEYLERVIKVRPSYAQAHANLADIHLALASHYTDASSRAKHLELARDGFAEAINLTDRASFYQRLGEVYFKMQDYKDASNNFGASAQLDPDYYQARLRLGDALCKLDRWADAVTNYLEANRLNKTSKKAREQAFTGLCIAYNHLNQSDSATESCRQALALNPNNQVAKQEMDLVSISTVGDR